MKGKRNGSQRGYGYASNLPAFIDKISSIAKGLGFDISGSPKKIRTVADKPLTNMSSIVSLINGLALEAVFDPYFDDKTINYMATLCNLGLKLAPTLRVISSNTKKSSLS